MQSIDQLAYHPSDAVLFSRWETLKDGSQWRVVMCTQCLIAHQLTKSDAFHGATKEYERAERHALQRMIDCGCTHISTASNGKGADPDEFGNVKKSGKSKPKK